MSSVRQIARRAGVSITTVSRALNNDPAVNAKTRELVLRIANGSGYVAKTGRRITTNIGLAYTQEMTVGHPFDSAVLSGVLRGLGESRFDVTILNIARDKMPGETFSQFFARKGVRGIILRTTAATRNICEEIADEGFPHVVISERFDAPNINCVDCDSRPDSARAVEYLIALGHRRIGFAVHNVPDRDHLDRLEGYKQALAKHALPFDPDLIFRHPITLAGGATVIEMAMRMTERPTALFFADPMLAVGALNQALSLGVRVPADISIIGFDDTDVRFTVHPVMTAVCQDASALGFEAALRLTRLLTNGDKASFKKTLPTFFEINESTGPAPSRPAVEGDHADMRDLPAADKGRIGGTVNDFTA